MNNIVIEVLRRAMDEKLNHLKLVTLDIRAAEDRIREYVGLLDKDCSDIEELADAINAEVQMEIDRNG